MKGRPAGWVLVAAVVAVAVCAAGCQPQRTTLVPTEKPTIVDVPVPTTFRLDPDHSSDFASRDTNERYNGCYYTGQAAFKDVENFYKRQMPVEGWRLEQDVGSSGRKTLYFKKSGTDPMKPEVPGCVVTIFAQGEYATAIQIVRMER